MKPHPGVCTGCSTGCSIWIEENQDRVYRLKPRENPHVNKWWMCNEGRYGYHHVHNDRRLTNVAAPRRRRLRERSNGRGMPGEIDERLAQGRPAGRRALAASDRRRSLPAGQVHPRRSIRRRVLVLGPGAVGGRGRDVSRAASRFAPRSARTAAASRRSSPTSPAAWPRSTTCWPASTRARSRGVWVAGGYKQRLDRRADGRAARSGSSCWSCKTCSPRRCRSGPRISCPAPRSPSATART